MTPAYVYFSTVWNSYTVIIVLFCFIVVISKHSFYINKNITVLTAWRNFTVILPVFNGNICYLVYVNTIQAFVCYKNYFFMSIQNFFNDRQMYTQKELKCLY